MDLLSVLEFGATLESQALMVNAAAVIRASASEFASGSVCR
jgi:hypothetical protein